MAEFFEQLRRLLRGPRSPAQPYVHEVLLRDEAEQAAYARWRESERFEEVRTYLRAGLVDPAASAGPDGVFVMIDRPTVRGFVIRNGDVFFEAGELTRIFDFLREAVLELGYRAYGSDVKRFLRPKFVETTERHYLKPDPRNLEADRVVQRYGNINIEHKLVNDHSEEIRFVSSIYTDRNFTEAASFDDLVSQLFG